MFSHSLCIVHLKNNMHKGITLHTVLVCFRGKRSVWNDELYTKIIEDYTALLSKKKAL